ncbi:MAG: hypothetical protein J6N15_04210 [Ruminiclostridium sp.]|nr:hypothetical protein [Ruminiclostridium sp.]
MARIPFIRNRNYNGITKKTVKNIQLGASAVFKNYYPKTDTYETAKAAGKILGATRGGVNIRIEMPIVQVVVDGGMNRIKGLSYIDAKNAAVSASFSMIEMTTEALAIALTAAEINENEDDAIEGYDIIEGTFDLAENDFIENITIIGCKSGADKPSIIQIFNGINEGGFTLQTSDDSSGALPVQVFGYGDVEDLIADSLKPPYRIYNPIPTAASNSVPGNNTDPEP